MAPRNRSRRLLHPVAVAQEDGDEAAGVEGGEVEHLCRARVSPPDRSVLLVSMPVRPLISPNPSVRAEWTDSWGSRRPVTSAPRYAENEDIDLYSDNEDVTIDVKGRRVIDMAEVSNLGESAPTSLIRDRRLNDKAKMKAEGNVKKEKKARQGKREADDSLDVDVGGLDQAVRVKPEPISPEKREVRLPGARRDREDDVMISDDEVQDRDEGGRRVKVFGGEVEVNESQKVDLSESESEEEEEDMEGDFFPVDGYVNALRRHLTIVRVVLTRRRTTRKKSFTSSSFPTSSPASMRPDQSTSRTRTPRKGSRTSSRVPRPSRERRRSHRRRRGGWARWR
jgi:hypothetical protein